METRKGTYITVLWLRVNIGILSSYDERLSVDLLGRDLHALGIHNLPTGSKRENGLCDQLERGKGILREVVPFNNWSLHCSRKDSVHADSIDNLIIPCNRAHKSKDTD